MAKNIKEITLYNFKAFYGENTIKLDGKNLLLYGENGSGKSSIYWALYTLLQSSTKTTSETEKYFNFNHDENLINRDFLIELDKTRGIGNYSIDIGNNVQIEIKDEDDNVFNLSLGGLSSQTNRNELANLNRYCDFITHRLLINFYNFRNSQEIDLWKIFNREIFPFVYDNDDNGDNTIEKLIKDLYESQPFILNDQGDYALLPDDGSIYEYYEKIKSTNNEISKLVDRIENEANLFFSKYFDNTNNDYKVQLFYTNKFFFGKNTIYDNENFKINGAINPLELLRTPQIILKIYKKAHDNYELISRPQTYLNEALITQLSLSIRLSLTKIRAVNYPGQFLVLDDMLISLDMSNREKVLDLILDVFAKDYKIYFLTHERSFFNLIKSRLIQKNIIEKWQVKELYMNTFNEPPKPFEFDNSDYLSKALKYIKEFDLPAAANYLRKECELRLKYLLPNNLSTTLTEEEGTKLKQLDDLILTFLKYYSDNLKQDSDDFVKLKTYKDFILNPLSHDNVKSEFYSVEVYDAYQLMLKLRKIKRRKVLNANSKFYYKTSNLTKNEFIYEIENIDELYIYTLLDDSQKAPNIDCIVTSEKEMSTGVEKGITQNVKFYNIQKMIYKYINKTGDLPAVPFPPKLSTFTNVNGNILESL